MLESRVYNGVISTVILFNVAMIGIESDLGIRGEPTEQFIYIEHVLQTVYTLEISFRFFAYGFRARVTAGGPCSRVAL